MLNMFTIKNVEIVRALTLRDVIMCIGIEGTAGQICTPGKR